jgi:hypothetical protein
VDQGSGRRKRSIGVGIAVVALATLAACLPVSGGGYVSGANGGKANFSFSVTCDTSGTDPKLVGAWNYNDKVAGVNVAGNFSSTSQPCSGNPEEVQLYVTNYTVQGKCSSSCTGLASIHVFDNGGRGTTKGDCLSIYLNGGRYDGYSNPASPSSASTACPGDPFSLKLVLGGNLKVG